MKWYHFRKGQKFFDKNGTIISEKGQNYQTKMAPFQEGAKIPGQQKWYHLRKGSHKKVSFEKRTKILQQKWYHFGKVPKFLNYNGTI